MPRDPSAEQRRLKELEELCEQAQMLKEQADEICAELAARLEATRVLVGKPERRKTPRAR